MCLRISPQLEKHFDREFFRTRGVAHHSRDYASDPIILRAENVFEVELNPGIHIAESVHKDTTPPDSKL